MVEANQKIEYFRILDLSDIVYFCEIDLVFKTEQWKKVKDYEAIYKISDLGRLKSLGNDKSRKEKILRQSFDNSGYLTVGLMNNGIQKTRTVHQLVAIAFLNHVPCGRKLVVNHKNFIKSDNRAVNFEIITSRENSNHKHIKSSSKYVGVGWKKDRNKWQSQIVINKKKIHLGYFDCEIKASEAYQEALAKIID